ncbi:hypothetical protein EDC04DRAFT_2891623 [Pisolithus marmoratus]|nr:hypothetical protein EDC04DRAFT_2891623 [Pisolithus marmoratus]
MNASSTTVVSMTPTASFHPSRMIYLPSPFNTKDLAIILDVLRGCQDVPGMENVSSTKLRSAVDEFTERMSLIYTHENERRERGLDALGDIFSACNDDLSFTVMANGHFLGPHRAACCVTEFQNESGCGPAIPYVEMTGYFAHSVRDAADCFYSASVMRAASVLLARIQGDAAKLVVNYPPPVEESRRILPPISSLCHPRSGIPIEFNILEFFHARAAGRYLYIAETTGGKQIMVKFTRHYSCDLHMFCADRGCAPALFGFQRLPGGFYGIAMELIQSAVPISQTPYIEKYHEWTERLWELVKSFHAEGLVHGDLRAPNIICDRNRVMLIGFDWGGKEGKVSYPNGPLNADLTIGRNNIDLKITKGDDIRVLDRTLKNVRMQST